MPESHGGGGIVLAMVRLALRPLPGICSLALVAASGFGCSGAPEFAAMDRPTTPTEPVEDTYHGVAVADPYRWLEDQDAPRVLDWAGRQNDYTEAYLSQVGSREAIRDRLTELWNFERFGVPRRYGDVWVYSKNDGLQDQSVFYAADGPAADGRILLDPNGLSSDGTASLNQFSVSKHGRWAAVGISKSGSDWVTWRTMEVASGAFESEELVWSKFSGAAWTHDEAGFFYQSYPAPAEGEVYEASNRNPQLRYHRVGTEQSEDRVVYERPDAPNQGFGATITDDGRYAIVRIWEGTDRRNRIAYIDLEDENWAVRPLLMDFDASYDFVGSREATFYFVTDHAAPNRRLIAVDLDRPQPEHWVEVIAEREAKLNGAGIFGGQWIAEYLVDASDALVRFDFDGDELGKVELPGIGSVSGLSGKPDEPVVRFSFESFIEPRSVYAHDLASGESRVLRSPELAYDPSDFVTERVAFQASDGARLAMFLVHRRGMRLDGRNRTYLYGYGGFNISLTPRFSVPNLVWIERGGLFVQATLRGGGEFGEPWHRAGMLANKQRVFDDFAECADYLIRNDYTSPDRLAIGGRSNGGLLVGATLNQHPERFGAAIPEVGVMDMLRYHTFTIGWAWASEYGRSDDPEMFPVLRAYSPLHNVRSDVVYPPTMVMTGDHDDRVLPGHSYKYAAALQAAQPDADILLRVQMNSGHGAGKPVRMLIGEATDRWAFLERALAD